MGVTYNAVALKEYKRVYENILAVEKKLDIAKKYLVSCNFTGGTRRCIAITLIGWRYIAITLYNPDRILVRTRRRN